LNLTLVAGLESWNPVPVIVTDVPTGPVNGRKAKTVGLRACAAVRLVSSTAVSVRESVRRNVPKRLAARIVCTSRSRRRDEPAPTRPTADVSAKGNRVL